MRMKALQKLGEGAVGLGSFVAKRVSGWFRKNPKSMGEFAAKVPALKGTQVSVRSITDYVRANPINSLMYLSLIPEGYLILEALEKENPEVARIMSAARADDTIGTLDKPRSEVEEDRIEAQEEIDSAISDLPLSAVMNFTDEAALIDRAIDVMPGRSVEERQAQFHELRRAITMPDSNFALYERLQTLRG